MKHPPEINADKKKKKIKTNKEGSRTEIISRTTQTIAVVAKKTKKHLERQEHLPKIKDQTVVCLQIMDINNTIMVRNPSIRNEMLQNHPSHLLHRPHYKYKTLDMKRTCWKALHPQSRET